MIFSKGSSWQGLPHEFGDHQGSAQHVCRKYQIGIVLWLNKVCAAQEPVGEGFVRADDTALKKRKIFKARRGAQAPPPAPAGAGEAAVEGANPFAGISLTPAAPAANPFAGVSLPAPGARKVPCPDQSLTA